MIKTKNNMAKITLNENELTQMVEKATRSALSKILKEGAGLNTIGQSFKAGLNGHEYMDIDGGNIASRYIKNGNGTNYRDFEKNREEFNKADTLNKKRQADLKSKKREPDAWTTAEMEKTQKMANNAKARKDDAAGEMIGSRPGIIGKGQRALNVGAYRLGKMGSDMKDKATDFIHNKIGFEE